MGQLYQGMFLSLVEISWTKNLYLDEMEEPSYLKDLNGRLVGHMGYVFVAKLLGLSLGFIW